MRRGTRRAETVAAGPPGPGGEARRLERVGPAARRRLLRRGLSRAPALSRIPALAARLESRPPRREDLPDRPLAAVAIVLAPDPDSILLIRRAEREGDHWSGQIALPGGRWSPSDPDLLATAKRETLEEVGVDLSRAPLVAALDDLAPRTPVLPPILVRPFVFTLPGSAALLPNAEVAGAWWIPLDQLLRPEIKGPIEFERAGALIRAPAYRLEQGVLWGMTERILTPILELFRATAP
jgi:8-oxo-dGTP pyrophosphatase MutT (NUDIX family)